MKKLVCFIMLKSRAYQILNHLIYCTLHSRPNELPIFSLCEIENFHKQESKRIIPLPTLEGLVFTSRNYVRLAKYLLCNGAFKICFKTFSQDVLETFLEMW